MSRWPKFLSLRSTAPRQRRRTLRFETLQDRSMLAVLTVNSLADNATNGNSTLTLREAIDIVNAQSTIGLSGTELLQIDVGTEALGTNDTIVFDESLATANAGFGVGTIGLSIVGSTTNGATALQLTHDVTIQGFEGNDDLTIVRDINVDELRLFTVEAGVSVTLSNLTLTGGRTVGADGGSNSGAVGLGGGAAGQGGAILVAAGAAVTVIDSTLNQNAAVGGNGGSNTGGLDSDGGTPDVGGSGGTGGGAGGLFAGGGGSNTLAAVGGAGGFGGGGAGGTAHFTTGGAGGAGGPLGAPMFGGAGGAGANGVPNGGGGGGGAGFGGAIFAYQGAVTLTGTTITNNTAQGGDGGVGNVDGGKGGAGGGGVFIYGGQLTIENSTLSGNQTLIGVNGGIAGILLGGNLGIVNGTSTVLNATFADGVSADGGAIYSLGDAATITLAMSNSILADSTSASDFFVETIHSGGQVMSGGGNLIVNNGLGVSAFTGGVASTTDPSLAALADNGGPTQTHAISVTSSAFNAGNTVAALSLTTDQRGTGFDRSQGDDVDIGAFELVVDAVVSSIARSNPSAQLTAAASVTFLVTFNMEVSGVTAANFALSGTATGGTIGTPATSDGGLTWTVAVTGLASSEGTLRLDLANNTGVSSVAFSDPLVTTTFTSGQSYTLDHVAVPPVFVDVTTDTGISAHDQITSDQTLTITGTAEANNTVTVSRTGVGSLGQVTADSNGDWSFNYTGTTLPPGTYTFTATATDLVNNVSAASTSFVVTVDTSALAPTIEDIITDTGISAHDQITFDQTLTFTGSAEANSTVTVSRTGVGVLGSTTVDSNGDWSFNYTGTTLPPGTYTFTATITDLAGNVSSASSVFTVTVDIVTETPVIADILNDTGSSAHDQITSDQTLTFVGTAEADSAVTLIRSGVGTLGTVTADSNGDWSFDYTATTLAAGVYTFTASSVDVAGNQVAISATFTVTVDTTAAAPVFGDIVTDTGSSAHDQITYDQTLTITGTAEANSIVAVSRTGVGVLGTTAADSNGDWSFNYTGTTLTPGVYTFTAITTDVAGNTSGVSSVFTVTVNSSPTTPQVTDATTQAGQQTTSGLVITPGVSDDTNVTHYKITNIAAGTLFLNDGVTLVGDGDFITAAQGAAGLKFTPTADDDGSFDVQASTTGDDTGLGGSAVTATIEVDNQLPTTIGLFDPTQGEFYLRNSNTGGDADLTALYGPAPSSWIAIAGDWDGDGVDTIGLYDPAGGAFFLRNSNDTGEADIAFNYGAVGLGWRPIVGDWDGNGTTTVGMFSPLTNTFYLRNTNDAGFADVAFEYGPTASGWLPLTGDWNGDGTFTVGLYDPVTSVFYLRDMNAGGFADYEFWYGLPAAGWRPISGDWDGDGTYTVGLYAPQTGEFQLRNSNTQGVADVTFQYGPVPSGWTPVTGRWTDVVVNSLALASPDQPGVSSDSSDDVARIGRKAGQAAAADEIYAALGDYLADDVHTDWLAV